MSETVYRYVYCVMNDAEGMVALLECGHKFALEGELTDPSGPLPCVECTNKAKEERE